MVKELQLRHQIIRKVLILVLLLNWIVALAKIIYGWVSSCASMTADGFHSFSDGASNVIGLIGIAIASAPKDKEHPYGHKKYETFFSLGIATLLLFLCFNLIKEGIKRIFHPVTPEITLESFLVMLVTLGINLWVTRYESRKGGLLKSDILVSDAMHTRADIFTSLSVIIALVVIKAGFPIIDPICTLIITIFIAHSAFEIIKKSSDVLCDTAPIVDVKKITGIVIAIEGVVNCHRVRTRGRPDDIHIDLHVQVNPKMHMDEAHQISYTIEKTIKNAIPEISDVVVHMEPKEG